MKSSHPIITLIGSNSGRNVGDAAIMASIIDVLSEEIPGTEFLVPSTNPSFTNDNYGKEYRVKGINVMPWTGSIRLLGIPTMIALAKSDVALICDGIIFGKKLFNPAFNFLITLIFLVPWARLVGCKMVCYSCGIGPFPSKLSSIFAKWVLNGCDLVIMREHDSKKLAEEIGVTKPIEVTGDAAFLNKVSDDKRAQEIAIQEGIDLTKPLIGINVTKYFDSWLEANEQVQDRGAFLKGISDGVKDTVERISPTPSPVLFSTQPMDEPVVHELAALLGAKVIANSTYLSHDMQAMMRRCGIFLGMRFHSVVLASAVETPIVGLIYAPKVRGFMRLLGCQDLAVELKDIHRESLANVIVKAWEERFSIREKQKAVVDELKRGARRAAQTLRARYFQEIEGQASRDELRVAGL